jgi:hypothetical protein
MALTDGRNTVAFDEIGREAITFLRDNSIDYTGQAAISSYPASTSTQTGYSVSMTATNGTVKVGAAGDRLVGRMERSEYDSKCAVQVHGVAVFSYTAGATEPALGRGVVCDGSGGVRIAAAASEFNERGLVYWKDATLLKVWVDLTAK